MEGVERYVRSWKDSMVNEVSGIKEWTMFRKHPNGVLQNIESFSRRVLDKEVISDEIINPRIQEIIYVVNGSAKIISSNREKSLEEGFGVYIPSKVSYRLVNESESEFEFLSVKEGLLGKALEEDIVVRDISKMDIVKMPDGSLYHWCHKPRELFSFEKESHILHVSIVDIDDRKLPEPHFHTPGTDEAWYSLKGKSKMLLGDRVIEHEPETAIMIPPDGKTEHSSLTPYSPASFFFFLCYPKG